MFSTDLISTPWVRGRLDGRAGSAQLLFGRMYEDWWIERSVFPPGSRVFCIASAGCTALALAGLGYRVTAVDINPDQIGYCQERARGAELRDGVVERLIARARRIAAGLGWSPALVRRFLGMTDPAEQARYWTRHLNTQCWRAALRLLLHPRILRVAYTPELTDALPAAFDRVVHARLAATWAGHPNRTNPYAWRLLAGCEAPNASVDPSPSTPPSFVCVEAAEFLEQGSPQSFDAFSLSNILDATTPDYCARLLAAVTRAASPGARLVIRSITEPHAACEAAWARRDRSPLWGAIRVAQLSNGVWTEIP